MRSFILFFTIWIICITVNAQDTIISRQWFERAEFHLFNKEYAQAAKIYENLLENDLSNYNILFHLSLCYLNLPGENKKAIYYLKKIFSNSTISSYESQYDYYIYLGKLYHIDHPEELNSKQDSGKGFKFDPYKSYTNLAISGDGKTLVFVKSSGSENRIFYIKKSGKIWSEAKEITSQVGSEGDCFPSSLSYDGYKLYLTKYSHFESDIYVSLFNGKSWSGMHKLNGNVNSLYYDTHACESPDGNVLYFASNRPGGFGGMDIYYSLKVYGDWGKPFNAGIRINTYLNEDYPLLTNGGRTLIFSSQGFKRGKDGYDIYYCNSVSENLWSVPVNLGYPVNTPEDDIYYAPLTEETQQYFNLSLLNTHPEESSVAEKDILVKGIVSAIDSTMHFEDIVINITDNANKNITDLAKVNNSGKFSMILKKGDFTLKIMDKDSTIKIVNFFIPFLTRQDTVYMNLKLANGPTARLYEYDEFPAIILPEANASASVKNSAALEKKTFPSTVRKVFTRPGLFIENLSEDAYTIQIYALRNYKEQINIGNLDSISVYETDDGYYKYIFGQFASEEAANSDLNKAKNNGFKDAFVTRVNKFKTYKLIYKKIR